MWKIEGRRSQSTDSSSWMSTWEAVSRLAPASAATLANVEKPRPARFKVPVPVPPAAAADSALPPIARDQLARDIAEIERAAVALRRAEPSLEPWLPDAQPRIELRKVRSVWVLIGMTWLSVASVVSCAIGAILLLFG